MGTVKVRSLDRPVDFAQAMADYAKPGGAA
jgi:hypothetical protein